MRLSGTFVGFGGVVVSGLGVLLGGFVIAFLVVLCGGAMGLRRIVMMLGGLVVCVFWHFCFSPVLYFGVPDYRCGF
jgi:hypothetical protein